MVVMPVLGNPNHGAAIDENMAGQVESSESAGANGSRAHAFKLRPYQLEMLEESMRRNIIVAVRNSTPLKDWEAKDL